VIGSCSYVELTSCLCVLCNYTKTLLLACEEASRLICLYGILQVALGFWVTWSRSTVYNE